MPSPAIREARGRHFELWCNGNTAGFGSAVPGSNPGGSTGSNPSVVSLIEGSFNQRKQIEGISLDNPKPREGSNKAEAG